MLLIGEYMPYIRARLADSPFHKGTRFILPVWRGVCFGKRASPLISMTL